MWLLCGFFAGVQSLLDPPLLYRGTSIVFCVFHKTHHCFVHDASLYEPKGCLLLPVYLAFLTIATLACTASTNILYRLQILLCSNSKYQEERKCAKVFFALHPVLCACRSVHLFRAQRYDWVILFQYCWLKQSKSGAVNPLLRAPNPHNPFDFRPIQFSKSSELTH